MVVRRVKLGQNYERDVVHDPRPSARVRPAATALIVQRPDDRRNHGGPFVLTFFDDNNDHLRTQVGLDTVQVAVESAVEVAAIRADDWQVVSEPFGSAPIISDDLLRQLLSVPTSIDGLFEYRPCCVRLRNGSWRDGVYIHDLETYLDLWSTVPGADRSDYELAFGEVVEIVDSPRRLPPPIANALYAAGESAMGGCYFVLVTRSGLRIPCQTGNFVDFVELPENVAPTDIVHVEPHADEARTASNPAKSLHIGWSVYDADGLDRRAPSSVG